MADLHQAQSPSRVPGPSSGLPPKPTQSTAASRCDRGNPRKKKPKAAIIDTQADYEELLCTPWLDGLVLDKYPSGELRLHEELLEFERYLRPIAQETEARRYVFACLETLVERRWPKADLHIFGSSAFDLVLPGGDLDVVMQLPQPPSEGSRKNLLYQMAALVKNAGIADYVQVVAHAKIPLIIFETRGELGSFSVDLSLAVDDNGGTKAISVVTQYLKGMPALRPLVIAMKAFLRMHDLNSASNGGLSSYAVICMCISFLQLNPMARHEKELSDPLSCKTLGKLLKDFLEYYADDFPYTTSCISVASGKIIEKESKGWVIKAQPDLLSIECPVNPARDVSRGTGKIRRVRDAFRVAYSKLVIGMQDPSDESILAQIVKLPLNLIERREKIALFVDSGRLQQAAYACRFDYHDESRKNWHANRACSANSYGPPRTGASTYSRYGGPYKSAHDRPPLIDRLSARTERGSSSRLGAAGQYHSYRKSYYRS